jgi:hypothetical protein
MKRSRLWLAAGLPLVLAACGGGDAEMEDAAVVETADTAAMATTPPAGMPMDTGMAAGGMMGGTVQMSPVGTSGVSGQAVLTDMNGQTQVVVTLTGATGTHQGHIHQGTCDAPGSVVAPLEPVTAGANASSTSTVAVPIATVMNGQHIIAYHEAGGEPGAPIVCGAIPQHSM